MNQYNNFAKISTNSHKDEYTLSLSNTKQTIALTNNRAKYYAELAEKYKNEAKEHRDNAQYYAEQNSDVTYEYINIVKSELEAQINTKQNSGNYAIKDELPQKISDLYNDSDFAQINDVINRDTVIVQQIKEGLETKVDKSSMLEVPCISETYVNGTSWYRVYSDGWCEQGGEVINVTTSAQTITLLKPYKDGNYYINCNQPLEATSSFQTFGITARNSDSFTVMQRNYNSDAGACNSTWQAYGYIA